MRWNQVIFQRFLEAGLAYRKNAPVNWCPGCHTVLANEQVLPDGTCERSGDLVVKRDLEQWFFRITAYADELLDALDGLDWPERVKTMQRNWIGRSEGAEFDLPVEGHDDRHPGVHHPAGHVVRHDVRGAGPRAPPGRARSPPPPTDTRSRPSSSGSRARPTSSARPARAPRQAGGVHRAPTPSTRSPVDRYRSTWPTTS